LRPSTNVPSTCPKSCCKNSPGSPSKRTTRAARTHLAPARGVKGTLVAGVAGLRCAIRDYQRSTCAI
jgi:hypothetical protein